MKGTCFSISFIVVLLFFNSCKTTPEPLDFETYDLHARQGYMKYEEGDYLQAMESFKKAIAIIPGENETDYLYASAAALHLDMEAEALNLVRDAIRNTNLSKVKLSKFKEYAPFAPITFMDEIFINYENYQKEFLAKQAHPEVYREVDSLVELDQIAAHSFPNSEDVKPITDANMRRLIEITEAYGWQKNAWIMLWNQRQTYDEDNFIWNFFIPHINKEIEAGLLRKDFWALFDDEKSIRTKQEQIYGLYYQVFKRYSIIDIENVDQRRADVGLPPLWYGSRLHGFLLPEGYKMPTPEEFDAYIYPEK